MLLIATRKSPLALWQAEHVQRLLQPIAHPREVSLLPLTTEGDRRLDVQLSTVGGKGLFIKELEHALLEGRAHLAVHSLKDVPATLTDGFAIPAVLERASPLDALVGPYRSIQALPRGCRVGTSSLRRQAQLLARRPDLNIVPVRGNVGTRLARLDAGDVDAMLLAEAGLRRLGLSDRIAAVLPPEESLPAAGQGALAIEIRAEDVATAALVANLHHSATATCVNAERRVAERLGGGCTMPLAAFAGLRGGAITLRAVLAAPDGSRRMTAEAHGDDPLEVGDRVADGLLAQGAAALLEAIDAARG